MKKTLIKIMIFTLVAGFSGQAGATSFDTYSIAARPSGMGNAFTALANDPSALLYNPAGLAQLKDVGIGVGYDLMYVGMLANSPFNATGDSFIGNGYLSAVIPIDKFVKMPMSIGTVAIGAVNLMMYNYMETSLMLSYSRGLNDLIGEKSLFPIYLGVTVKYLMNNITVNDYTALDPALSAPAASGISLDAGALFKFVSNLDSEFSLGIYGADLISPAIGGSTVPMKLRGGLCYNKLSGALGFAMDVDVQYSMNDAVIFGAGMELLFAKRAFAFRLGINTYEFTLGLGYNMGKFGVDYGMSVATTALAATSQRLAVNLNF